MRITVTKLVLFILLLASCAIAQQQIDLTWQVTGVLPTANGGMPDTGTTANVAIVSDGSHSAAVATGTVSTGGSGTSAITYTPTTIGGLSGLSPSTNDVVLVSDATACGDVATGGGSTFEWLKYSGSAWQMTSCSGTPVTGSGVLISERLLASPASSFTFSSIAGTYRDLIVRCTGRGSAASTNIEVRLQFNGDTGANYDNVYSFSAGTGSTTNASTLATNAIGQGAGALPAASSIASYPGSVEYKIQNYTGTTFFKQAQWMSGFVSASSIAAANVFHNVGSGWWRNTAAITQVVVVASSGNFVTGTRCSLYGSY